ncbi:uncharacterized protein LOC119399516 isoform X2 [Rhipicephalus sanguineus]|uniref:uncharacterized protein LOC119399516 isoform X2 n=1 Tax=Rhipicephalus sanguineus TaxID=34632 RepID=UPI0020C41CB8|nr:uncharacterized protein LOC119399516 isoform X2 [Rhipicephalus sanguineus]
MGAECSNTPPPGYPDENNGNNRPNHSSHLLIRRVTIKGTVLSVVCNRSTITRVKEETRHSNVCIEEFSWHIPDPWCSPVELLYNVTVPMIRKDGARKVTQVELNLTKGGWQIAEVQWGDDLLHEGNMRYVTKNCTFIAAVQFSGSKEPATKGQDLENIREICNLKNKQADAGHRAVCLITGEYKQNVCRYPRYGQDNEG